MNDNLVLEMLSILCIVFHSSFSSYQEKDSSYHWMILEIYCLILQSSSPKSVFNSIHSTITSSSSSSSSLRSLLQQEQQKTQFYERQLPSSFSDSYNSTSVNRLISQQHKIENYIYKPRTVVITQLVIMYSIFLVEQRNIYGITVVIL